MSKAFGEQTPTLGEDPVSWQTWSDGAGGIPEIVGNADWGKLKLDYFPGEEGRSAVYDLGSAKVRKFTLTENRYGTGSEDAVLQYRVDTISFLQDDVLPAWTNYSVPFSVNCRYVQVRETTLAFKFVDATNGNDGWAGTFAAPWKTIAKVNAATLVPGDFVLFKRGEVWREKLVIPSSGAAGYPITFGAYGTGAKPKILGSVNLSEDADWEVDSGNIWKTTATITVDVGNLIFNNEASCGVKRGTKVACVAQGEFFWEDGTHLLYLYSTSNPGTFYTAIEAAKYNDLLYISERSNITIQDLDIRYEGHHAIFLDGWEPGISNITIQRCNFAYIGGVFEGAPDRAGNGIEVLSEFNNVIIRYNTFEQIYDSSFCLEIPDANRTSSNYQAYYNITKNSEQGFLYLVARNTTHCSLVRVYNNVFYNMGGGFSHSQRVENEASGFTYWGSSGITTNCEFKNNIIHTSAEYLAFISPGSALAGGWTLDYNNYYPDGAAAFYYAGDDYTFANWKIATGGDANSIVTDPKFVTNGTDFHLQLGSGAINEGVNVGLSTDMDGVAVADPPEIGAFEYI